MSFEAVSWATTSAPIADVNEFAVLVMLAERADKDGCNAFPAKATLAARTRLSPLTVTRCLHALESRGLIARGNQAAAGYLRADRRPVVYDLLIPFTKFSDAEKINEERAAKGLPPLTPAERPDIPDAPAKRSRKDKGTTRTAQAAEQRGNSETPREDGHGVTTSSARGNYKIGTGYLRDTRTSPLNQSKTLSSPESACETPPAAVAEPGDVEREAGPSAEHTPAPAAPANAVARAWADECARRGVTPARQAVAAVARRAAGLLAEGERHALLTAAARDMARVNPRYRDLGRHLEHFTPAPGAGVGDGAADGRTLPGPVVLPLVTCDGCERAHRAEQEGDRCGACCAA